MSAEPVEHFRLILMCTAAQFAEILSLVFICLCVSFTVRKERLASPRAMRRKFFFHDAGLLMAVRKKQTLVPRHFLA